jgi:transposase InsO family protein
MGGGEVLFDRICRRNGIAHRLTQPRSPTTTGKVERFHQTMRREWLDQAGPFLSLAEAQAALDGWVSEYNERRPHQALAGDRPVTPSERFQAVGEGSVSWCRCGSHGRWRRSARLESLRRC